MNFYLHQSADVFSCCYLLNYYFLEHGYYAFFLCFKIKSSRSIALLILEGTSLITLSIITRIASTICSRPTKSKTQVRSLISSPKPSRKDLSIESSAQLVITENIAVTLNAVYQAPMSLTPLGVGFLANLQILYASNFNSITTTISTFTIYCGDYINKVWMP